MSLFSELKRRNVFRVGIAYLVVAWLVMQIADVILNNIQAPDWVFGAILLMLGIGFPFALVFSWAYELTPDGLKRDSEVDPKHSVLDDTGRRLDRAIMLALVVAVMYFFWESRLADERTAAPPIPFPGRLGDSVEAPAAEAGQQQSEQSIAVLPFVNMSSDPEQEYFSDGITEEIINAVVKIPGVAVPARTSVFGFKNHQGDIREVGRALGVAHVLEGSIRSQGDQVRITAQLIRVDNGFHMWSETYDRRLDNIFAVQEDIAAAIAAELVGELGGQVATVPNRTGNMQAYDLYLQARAALRFRDDSAIELLTRATQADPEFAPAWAALAIAYQSTNINNAKAIEMADRALALDPGNTDAMTAKAGALRTRLQWQESEALFERALAIDPDSTELLEDYAEFLAYTGRTREALEATSRGVAIDAGLLPLAMAHIEACCPTAGRRRRWPLPPTLSSARRVQPWLWYSLVPLWLDPTVIELHAPLPPMPELPASASPEMREFAALFQQYRNGPLSNADIEVLKREYTVEERLSGRPDPARQMLIGAGQAEYVLAVDLALFEQDALAITPMSEWLWTPLHAPLRRLPGFAQYLEQAGLIAYWDATAWPHWCSRNNARRGRHANEPRA